MTISIGSVVELKAQAGMGFTGTVVNIIDGPRPLAIMGATRKTRWSAYVEELQVVSHVD